MNNNKIIQKSDASNNSLAPFEAVMAKNETYLRRQEDEKNKQEVVYILAHHKNGNDYWVLPRRNGLNVAMLVTIYSRP